MSDVPPSREEIDSFFVDEEEKPCFLSVKFEVFDLKYAEEEYPVEMTVTKWGHVKRHKYLYHDLEKKCSDNEVSITDSVKGNASIPMACHSVKCRSLFYRQKWSQRVQVLFNDVASQLVLVKHQARAHKLNCIYKLASESLLVSSGKATVYRTKSGIVIVTDTINKGGVEMMLSKWSTWGESGYISGCVSVEEDIETGKRDARIKRASSEKGEGRRKKSSERRFSTFTLPDNKQKLLHDCPKAFEYFRKHIDNSEVALEVGDKIRLIVDDEHYEEALTLLSLIRTEDLKVQDIKNVSYLRDELLKRNVALIDKVLLQIGTANNILNITATDDVFDEIVQSWDTIRSDCVRYQPRQETENIVSRRNCSDSTRSKTQDKWGTGSSAPFGLETGKTPKPKRPEMQVQDRRSSTTSRGISMDHSTFRLRNKSSESTPSCDKVFLSAVLSNESGRKRETFSFSDDLTTDTAIRFLKSHDPELYRKGNVYVDEKNGKLVLIGSGARMDECFENMKRSWKKQL